MFSNVLFLSRLQLNCQAQQLQLKCSAKTIWSLITNFTIVNLSEILILDNWTSSNSNLGPHACQILWWLRALPCFFLWMMFLSSGSWNNWSWCAVFFQAQSFLHHKLRQVRIGTSCNCCWVSTPAHSIVYHHTEASLISCLQIGIHFGKRDDLKSNQMLRLTRGWQEQKEIERISVFPVLPLEVPQKPFDSQPRTLWNSFTHPHLMTEP